MFLPPSFAVGDQHKRKVWALIIGLSGAVAGALSQVLPVLGAWSGALLTAFLLIVLCFKRVVPQMNPARLGWLVWSGVIILWLAGVLGMMMVVAGDPEWRDISGNLTPLGIHPLVTFGGLALVIVGSLTLFYGLIAGGIVFMAGRMITGVTEGTLYGGWGTVCGLWLGWIALSSHQPPLFTSDQAISVILGAVLGVVEGMVFGAWMGHHTKVLNDYLLSRLSRSPQASHPDG